MWVAESGRQNGSRVTHRCIAITLLKIAYASEDPKRYWVRFQSMGSNVDIAISFHLSPHTGALRVSVI